MRRWLMHRYAASSMLAGMLVALAALVSVMMVVSVIDDADRFGVADALRMAVLQLPSALHDFVPFVALIGVMAGLSWLHSSGELTAMRACGLPSASLAAVAVALALCADLAALALRQAATLPGTERIQQLRAKHSSEGKLRRAFWVRDGDSFLRVDSLSAEGVAEGVRLYRFEPGARRLLSSLAAESMRFERGAWTLRDVRETRFTSTSTQVAHSPSRVWRSRYDAADLRLLAADPRLLPPTSLLFHARSMDAHGMSGHRHWLAFWQQLLQPLDSVALALVGFALVLGTGPRAGVHLFAGVLLGVGFRIVETTLESIGSVLELEPLVIVPLPAALALGCVLSYWRGLRRAGYPRRAVPAS